MSPSHFGEWMQGRLGPKGPVVLVTLACPLPAVRLGTGSEIPLAGAFCAELGVTNPDLRVTPLFPPGAGCGVSTASLLKIAGGAEPERLAQACVAIEGATDPLMWPSPDTLLWAPRQGRIVTRLRRPPACEILGGFFGPPTPTDPADMAFPDIADLVVRYEAGEALFPLARESAIRTTALRGPANDPTAVLATSLGAVSYARAHTGSARALVFPVGGVPHRAEVVLREAGLSGITRFVTGYSA